MFLRRSKNYKKCASRYSHDEYDKKNDQVRGKSDEKRRTNRRKGVYIDSADWNSSSEKISPEHNLEIDMSLVNLAHLKDSSSLLFLNSPLTDNEGRSGDGNTPDSDSNKPPSWPKIDSCNASRRTSLSCQSSEEKDDNYPYQLPFSYKHNKSLSFFRTDSISDSENNEKPTRDRSSTSPAPSESDYIMKRYSKRPLRGPYGQMLEAEMQKQSKNNYEEILEELKDNKERFVFQIFRLATKIMQKTFSTVITKEPEIQIDRSMMLQQKARIALNTQTR